MSGPALRRLVVATAVAGMLTTAGWALDRTYTGDLLLRLCAGAAVAAVLVSLLARRLAGWAVAPLSVTALAGYALLTTWLSARAAGVPGPVLELATDVLRNAVPRLLSALEPVEPQPDTVLVPVLATWLAGLAAAEIVLRTGRALPACAPPLVLFGAALVLVGPHPDTATGPALAFVGCVAVALAATAAGPATAGPVTAGSETAGPAIAAPGATAHLRLLGSAGLALAGVLALGAAAGPLLATRIDQVPADLRREIPPPVLDALDENPLVRLSGWALTPDQRLLDADVSGAAGPVRIRLAVMGDYDGVTWRVGATYRDAGRVLPDPPPPGEGVSHRPLRQKITIAGLEGRLLPAAPAPRRIDGVRVAYDEASGTVALPGGLRPGIAYTVRSEVPTFDVNVLPGLDVPAGPTVARFLALGSAVPPEMGRLAAQLGEESSAPYQRALAIEQFLAEHYQLVADAPSGHAYPNLSFFLFGPRNGGGQRGTSEQFAASFAVLGRALGLPTRVVLGFTARPDSPQVRAADAYAWPEVLFDGVGWVAFNPLPQTGDQPRPVEDDFRPTPPPSATPPTSVPPPSESSEPPPSPSASSAAPVAARPADHGPALLAGVLAAGVVGGYVVAVPLLRRRITRRRLRPDAPPADRVAGAWREVLDALRLAGRRPPDHLVVTEVAAHAAAAVAPPAHAAKAVLRPARPAGPRDSGVRDLARLANVAAFGPDAVAAPQADAAVALARSYVGELHGRERWWRRLRWSLDPRPLWWSRRG